MKQILSFFLFLICLFMIILCPNTVLAGAKSGLTLWYSTIVPTLLPFILLTSAFLNYGSFPVKTTPSRNNLRSFINPSVLFCVSMGFFCGYPMGAKLVNNLYEEKIVSKKYAQALLCICNNASPIFILGYVGIHGLDDTVPVFFLFLCIYLPVFLYFMMATILYGNAANTSVNDSYSANHGSAPVSFDSIIMDSVTIIVKIGIYVMIFSILTTFCAQYILPACPSLLVPIASLEFTNGIAFIKTVSMPAKEKTALILAITAFGGFSSTFQSKSVLTNKELSLFPYAITKILLGAATYICAKLCYPLFI